MTAIVPPVINQLNSIENDRQELINMTIAFYHTNEGKKTSDVLKNLLLEKGIIVRTFYCPREPDNTSHNHVFIFKLIGDNIVKIGQSPSIADLARIKIEKYRKFNNEIYQELNLATGLASHGIGVGSFVYLRRIIEKHIVQPKLDELEPNKRTGLDFKRKIQLVKDNLPTFLTENTKVYSVLSKGIHELTEDECKTYFPILRTSIEIILDEQIENQEKEKKKSEIRKQLGKIS